MNNLFKHRHNSKFISYISEQQEGDYYTVIFLCYFWFKYKYILLNDSEIYFKITNELSSSYYIGEMVSHNFKIYISLKN